MIKNINVDDYFEDDMSHNNYLEVIEQSWTS